jgi:redox-sensing transcriptional repressor
LGQEIVKVTNSSKIPDIVIGRLPIYLRALSFMAAEGQEITSSHELGEKLGISSAQIRKDLSHFGEFGKQGTGYNIEYLHQQLQRILQVDREWEVALIGAGDLGNALAHYGNLLSRGYRITAIFDNNPAKQGQKLGDCVVMNSANMEQVLKQRTYKVAIIAVPASAAQEVADICVNAGVKALLNYAPITLTVPEDVHVQYIDPVLHLQRMTYYL